MSLGQVQVGEATCTCEIPELIKTEKKKSSQDILQVQGKIYGAVKEPTKQLPATSPLEAATAPAKPLR